MTLLLLTLTLWSGPDSLPAPDARLAPGYAAAVVLAGDEILVGQARATTSPPQRIGAVHVFRRSSAGWSERGTFGAGDTKVGDGFGASLAYDGGTLAVGAPRGSEGHGAVYLFTRSAAGAWTEALRLVLPDGAEGDLFGATLALRDGLLVVGAPGRDSARGAAYAFRKTGTAWGGATPVGTGLEAADRFGSALAIAGDRIVVGAPGPLGGPGQGRAPARAGQARAFQPAGGGWQEEASLLPGSDSVRAFGAAVAALGEAVFVSTPLVDGSTGAVYAFRREGGTWQMSGRVMAISARGGARFGAALAADESRLFVTSLGTPQIPGGVHVFERTGSGWAEREQLQSGDPVGDGFGAVVSGGGGLLLATAPGADFGEGKVHVFARESAGTWRHAATLIDAPPALPAVTGTEVRCGDAGEAAGFKCRSVDLLAFLPSAAIGGRRGVRINDLWGWTDPETGHEYALVGRMDGTSFVDVTDPAPPVYLGNLPLHAGAHPAIWRDIKVYHDHAFIVADGAGPHGMQVFDLTRLRRAAGRPVTFTETPTTTGSPARTTS